MKYVLLLSNVRPEDANTTLDHQAALVNRDDASVFVLNPLRNREAIIDFKQFDAIIIHYSLVCFLDNYINIAYRRAIQDFSGLKVIFIQDEYRNIYSAVDAMVGLGIDVLFTMVPKEAIEPIYGRLRRRGVRVESTLAGYAPDNLSKLPQTPLAARPLDVVYRGRLVPFSLGRLGTEKVHISKRFEELAPAYGLKVDLDWREEARIYGPDWPKFLSSGRVALGTESGASICDFTGELDKAVSLYLRERPGAAFEDVYRDILHCYEGNVLMNVVSPRVFEAIALCTALVQFPGSYSGVLCVDQHYIPLAKDFSNIDEVVDKIRDVGFLEKLVARAYGDIIRSERYSFRKFGNEVFAVMREEWERRVHTHPHVPMLVGEAAHKKVESWEQLSIDSWREEIERGWREETEREVSERLTKERELKEIEHRTREIDRDNWRKEIARELKEIEHRTREIERDNWRKEIERELKEIEHRAQIHNLALANKGAWISASSDFYPRPHDADYVLRSPIAGGYAAAQGGAGDDFIEIDLGRPAQVNAIEIDWFDGENYPRHLRVEGAVMAGEPLEMLFETTGNTSTSSIIPLEPETVLKRVRVAASRFVGEKRMLLRGLRVLGNPEPTESDARAADEIDALDAERGAAILAASGFFPAPHNPAYLLRASGAGGYAAGLHEAGLPQWIEFDLGQPYEVRAVEIAWHSAEELAMDFELMVRGQTTEPWIPYAYEKKNWKQVSFLRRDPILARFVRLSATRFSREKRFLIRAMHVWAREPSCASGTESLR